MTFNSIEFLIFLPVVFLLYWFVFNRNVRLQNVFLLAASYVFYGWWDVRFLSLIILTSFCTWGTGVLMERSRQDKRRCRAYAIANVVLNLLILFAFKYCNFFVTSFAELFSLRTDSLLLKVILPVGVSFYTFQAVAYTIDVYKEKTVPAKNAVDFFAFLSFFPQLVAGPIERASNLLPQILKPRTFGYDLAADGCRQILWGMFKKVAVADRCAEYADMVFSSGDYTDGSRLLFGALMFTFQIYGDFSGYSDIAIGTSKLFGIRLSRNFSTPFFSRNIAEFWRRWHMTLMTWFRDYVYIPLGGSRGSRIKTIRNLLIVFLATGLWHGANWTFVAWGCWNALLFIPLTLTGRQGKYRNTVAEGRTLPSIGDLLRMLLTFLLITMGFVLFRSESICGALDFIMGMCQFDSLTAIVHFFAEYEVTATSVSVIVMLLVEWIDRSREHALTLSRINSLPLRYAIYIALITVIVFFWNEDSSQFIYFQF